MPVAAIVCKRVMPICVCTRVTSVMNEPNSDTAAITAEPMAIPLVMALVVLPTASRSAMIWRALRVRRPAISPMPLALSEIGPKESMATLLPVSVNMPMPVIATPYRHERRLLDGVVADAEPKIKIEARIVSAITTAAHTVAS